MDIIQALSTRDWLREEVLSEFGYSEKWTYREIVDESDNYWFVSGNSIVLSEGEPFTPEVITEGKISNSEIIGKKSLSKDEKWVLFAVDTNTDGNEFLFVLDVSKECQDKELINLYEENW